MARVRYMWLALELFIGFTNMTATDFYGIQISWHSYSDKKRYLNREQVARTEMKVTKLEVRQELFNSIKIISSQDYKTNTYLNSVPKGYPFNMKKVHLKNRLTFAYMDWFDKGIAFHQVLYSAIFMKHFNLIQFRAGARSKIVGGPRLPWPPGSYGPAVLTYA